MCLMRHRPIKKVSKSFWLPFLGCLVNLAIAFLFYYTLRIMFINPDLLPRLHDTFVWSSLIFFSILTPSFILSMALEPGFLSKKYDFVDLVSEFIEKEKDLLNLCTYCELIKSETSFHCLFCGRCTELFDHHCPFINNCLGYRNYRYFLIFIFSYFLFLCVISAELIRNQVETIWGEAGAQFKVTGATIILMVLIGLSTPVIWY
jgi:hypothetical protein